MPRLPPGQQLAAAHKWPTVGEREPLASSEPWSIEVCGCVRQPRVYRLVELQHQPQVTRQLDIHCVTRWSKLEQEFTGVELARLIEAAQPTSSAVFVSFVAQSAHQHSTSLPLDHALDLGTLIATQYAGKPLTREHGGPARVIVPERYFYKSLKWLTKIELLAEDRLGYWEATAGYHNHADPWREERYLASSISRQQSGELIARRDFRGLDLRGIDGSGRDLERLAAAGALLRDADLRDAKLSGADFTGANLSNARLQRADLRSASFCGSDVEGADFCGADLRGADFRGASIFGATFVHSGEQLAAQIDATTQFNPDRLEDLFPEQAEFVRQAIARQPS